MKAIYRKTASKLLAVFMACVIILSYSGIANAEEGMSWSFSKTFKVKMATVLNSDGGIVGVDVVGAEKAKEYHEATEGKKKLLWEYYPEVLEEKYPEDAAAFKAAEEAAKNAEAGAGASTGKTDD